MMNHSQRMMFLVLLCLAPGLLVSSYYLGHGIAANVAIAMLTVSIIELCIAYLRQQSIASAWDGSGLVAAAIFALCLPPDVGWSITMFGAGFAILFGKLLYGGLGNNPFNPAMVGYCALIVSFPLAMSTWPAIADGLTGATALDSLKWRQGATIDEIWQMENGFGVFAGIGYEWIAASYLVGGLALLGLRVIKWHGPISMLATLILLSVLFYDGGGSTSLGSPMFHLFSGGTLLAAFFVVTDPVTSPDTDRGMLLFGCSVGLITFVIRSIGAYPDGIAFAILLSNALVPLWEQMRLRRQGMQNK